MTEFDYLMGQEIDRLVDEERMTEAERWDDQQRDFAEEKYNEDLMRHGGE